MVLLDTANEIDIAEIQEEAINADLLFQVA